MTEQDDKPILYVLMRNDLPDYQAGKCMAQANHAGTQFTIAMGYALGQPESCPNLEKQFQRWANEAEWFGTCIVLGATYKEMETRLAYAGKLGHLFDIVLDETYPVRDGHEVQTLPVETCGWIFCTKSEGDLLLGDLKLF